MRQRRCCDAEPSIAPQRILCPKDPTQRTRTKTGILIPTRSPAGRLSWVVPINALRVVRTALTALPRVQKNHGGCLPSRRPISQGHQNEPPDHGVGRSLDFAATLTDLTVNCIPELSILLSFYLSIFLSICLSIYYYSHIPSSHVMTSSLIAS